MSAGRRQASGWVFVVFPLDIVQRQIWLKNLYAQITPMRAQCFFFSRDIFFGARDIFGKNARDIKKKPVTNFGKNARDIPDFKSSKIPY